MAFSFTKGFVKFERQLLQKCGLDMKFVRHAQIKPEYKPYTPSSNLTKEKLSQSFTANSNFKFIYPEFLPNPDVKYRNYLREKLERVDMLNRRTAIDIPEFYVGSIVAVKLADPHAQSKTNRFVGICIEKKGYGLHFKFTLRNIIDHQGIEIQYSMYDPLIEKIQILRLEKRLDDRLVYLRDAPEKYCTFDFDMEPEILPEGSKVPVNRIQIELNPKPWSERWERQNLQGIYGLEKHLIERDNLWLKNFSTPWDKFDLMKKYRKGTPEEEQNEIWSEVYSKLHDLEETRNKLARKRIFSFPKKKH